MDIYTVDRISKEYNLSKVYIKKEIRSGRLDASLFPGRAGYRITQEALSKWVQTFNQNNKG